MWLDQPEKELPKNQIPLLRAKAGKTIEANLTGRPLRLYVHFAARRSWPCTASGCSLCKRGVAKRYYAYYPVIGREGNVALVELTSLVEDALITQMGPDVDVPSGNIELHRPGGRRNIPCSIQWNESEIYKQTGGGSKNDRKQTTSSTLTENEMKEALMRIWKLPKFNGTLSESEYLSKLNIAIELQTKTHS